MKQGKIIYISGFSGAGKTTLALELQKRINQSIVLDGDRIRETINKDLGFTPEEKIENIRRNNELIKLLYKQGLTVICAFMASVAEERDKLFEEIPNTVQIQLTTPIEECIKRDVKGFYKDVPDNFAGINAKYTPLPNPSLQLDTSRVDFNESIIQILRCLYK